MLLIKYSVAPSTLGGQTGVWGMHIQAFLFQKLMKSFCKKWMDVSLGERLNYWA